MLRKTSFAPNHYYHIYNRGTDKREIFANETDYLRFTALLYICNNTEPVNIRDFFLKKQQLKDIFATEREKTIVDIGAYCLMPNHFHILLKENSEFGISVFMKKLCTAYAVYFNRKNGRSGNLFQGRFKAELADTDNYLKYLFAYIHLNPIKLVEPEWKEKGINDFCEAKKFLKNYKWSSYCFYGESKRENPVLNEKEFPKYFGGTSEFQKFIDEWLNYKGPSFV